MDLVIGFFPTGFISTINEHLIKSHCEDHDCSSHLVFSLANTRVLRTHLKLTMSYAPVCRRAIIIARSLASVPLFTKYTFCQRMDKLFNFLVKSTSFFENHVPGTLHTAYHHDCLMTPASMRLEAMHGGSTNSGYKFAVRPCEQFLLGACVWF